jgi:hypothetical protein
MPTPGKKSVKWAIKYNLRLRTIQFSLKKEGMKLGLGGIGQDYCR